MCYWAWLLLGVARYEMHQFDDAWQAFTTALEDRDIAPQASQWLALVERER